MASPPRTGRFALQALVVGAILVVAVIVVIVGGGDLIGTGQRVVSSLFPPIAVTAQGERIRDLYTIVFLIAIVVFFVVESLILWTVIRYRRKPDDDELPPQTHGNAIAEVVWTVVPTLIVAFLFVISWQTLNNVEIVSAQPDEKIQATAGQFQWTFSYLPDDYDPNAKPRKEPLYTQLVPTGQDGGLVIPAGRTVQLYLESKDVIHAFYVPQFLFKRDVVPGRTNLFEFTVKPEDAGNTFRGQCAELCGAGHRVMLFEVHALAPADFDAWLKDQIAKAAASPSLAPSGAAPSGAAPSGAPPSGAAPSGAAPSGAPASGAPAPSGGAAGPTLAVSALNIAYDTAALQAPADTPFKIDFDNQDNGVPHNIAIHDGSPTGAEVWKGEVFAGPAKKTYDVPALKAGTYGFVCSVHPNMTGTLTVN